MDSTRMKPPAGRKRFLGVVLVAAVGLFLAGCSSSGLRVSMNGVTEVRISSYQALPPPYTPPHVTLTSSSDLKRFSDLLDAHAISIVKPTEGGCGGGTSYTMVLVRGGGAETTLHISPCAGKYFGNVGGTDLNGFVEQLDAMLK